MSTSHEEYVEAHDAYVKACGKVDVHLETCTYCDDFRSPDHYCEEADKLLKLVEETCKRRNQSVQSLHPELDLIQSSPTLSG